MLDLALLRAEPERVRAALARRGVPASAVEAVVDLDRRWSARQEVRQSLRTRRRQISDEVARRKTDQAAEPGGAAEAPGAPDLVRAGRRVGREVRAVEQAMADLASRREAALLALPNLPATDVPASPPPREEAGPPWPKPFPPLPHWDLLEMLGLASPAGASAGSGFLLWRDEGARLVRGLVRFMLDVHTREAGRREVLAPPVATRRALVGSAHLPTLEARMYRVVEAGGDPGRHPGPVQGHAGPSGSRRERGAADEDTRDLPVAARGAGASEADLFLAPRAEPHLAALHAGTILEAEVLPLRLVAAATAMRRASHGGGAAARGLLRLGAFPTVEVYTLCRPEEGEVELESALRSAETVLERLGVACRRRLRGAAELSHAAARTVSLDLWCPGLTAGEDQGERGGSLHPPRDARGKRGRDEDRPRSIGGRPPGAPGRWVEAAALASFTDYQARRTGTQFRGADGRARLVHTVGGAAVAVPRLVAAILERGQEADGSVRLPEGLEPYVGARVLGAR